MSTDPDTQLDTSSHAVEGAAEKHSKRRPLNHRLTFPKLVVNDTIASLAFPSSSGLNIMPAEPRSVPAAGEGDPLEYSYVNIPDDALSLSDDEEGHTASLTSGGRETPDDLSSLADTDFSVDEPAHEPSTEDGHTTEAEEDVDTLESSSESVMDATMNDTFSMESTLTARPLEQSIMEDGSRRELTLKPHEQVLCLNIGEYSLTSFPDLERYGRERVRVTVQQTVSNRTPNALDRELATPLKVLVLGVMDKNVFSAVTQKIIQAMVACRLKSGENIFDKMSECSRLVRFSQFREHAQTAESKVDLIIYLHTAAEQSQINKSEQELYSSLRESRAVPSLDIASPHLDVESPSTKSVVSYIYNPRGLHTRVSDPDQPFSERNALQVNPVDLNTFLKLEPGMLAKHLACIMDPRAKESRSLLGLRALCLQNVLAYFKGLALDVRRSPLIMAAIVMPLLLLLAVSVAPSFTPLQSLQNITVDSVDIESSTTSLIYTTPSSLFSSSTTSTSLVASVSVPPKPSVQSVTTTSLSRTPAESSIKKAVGMSLIGKHTPKINESKDFKGQVIGSNVIVLTPPKFLAERRKPPQLHVEVIQEDQTLESKISRLENGAYAVEIPRKDAFGKVEVKIWTSKKPKVNQVLVLDLGSRWNKATRFQDAVADIAGLSCAWGSQEEFWQGFKKKAADAQNKLHQTSQSISDCVSNMDTFRSNGARLRQEVQEASKAIFEQASELIRGFDPVELWENVPRFQHSKHLKKAHRNAKGLWEKVSRKREERAAARKERSSSRRQWRMRSRD